MYSEYKEVYSISNLPQFFFPSLWYISTKASFIMKSTDDWKSKWKYWKVYILSSNQYFLPPLEVDFHMRVLTDVDCAMYLQWVTLNPAVHKFTPDYRRMLMQERPEKHHNQEWRYTINTLLVRTPRSEHLCAKLHRMFGHVKNL